MPREPIPAPPPAARPINLRTSARLVDDGLRWENGIAFDPEPCVAVSALDPSCEVSPATKSEGDSQPTIFWDPYAIYFGNFCDYAPNEDLFDQLVVRARRGLEVQTSHMVENILSSGIVNGVDFGLTHPNLALKDATSVGTPAPPVGAMAQMDAMLRSFLGGRKGMIHVPVALMHQLAFYGLIRREGNTWRTVTGHLVAPGTGYPGTDPDGNDDGNVWIYGTSMVEIRLSEVVVLPGTVAEAIDRGTNQLVVRAERLALAYWDRCAHIGVPVCDTDPGPDCGSES